MNANFNVCNQNFGSSVHRTVQKTVQKVARNIPESRLLDDFSISAEEYNKRLVPLVLPNGEKAFSMGEAYTKMHKILTGQALNIEA